jgi:hypothetical protein
LHIPFSTTAAKAAGTHKTFLKPECQAAFLYYSRLSQLNKAICSVKKDSFHCLFQSFSNSVQLTYAFVRQKKAVFTAFCWFIKHMDGL